MLKLNSAVALVVVSFCTSSAFADQGSFTNSGGTASGGSGVSISSTTSTPAGTLTMNCPGTGPTTCSGGNLTFNATDGSSSINAAFTSGTFVETCSGGGRGGTITCSYSFTGYFRGAWTVNGATQAITGVTSQAFRTGGAAATGTTAFASAYTPFYYSDSEQIHRADDLQGTNQISYGSQGGGVGQFYGAYGIALDSSRRIYVADTYNCRIVRIDDMNGSNWTSYGTCGAGQGQFYDPSGIAIDHNGKIYVFDTGNSRVVRMDDMNGTNWAAYGSIGSGNGQFAQYGQSLAVDSSSRVYVADTGNKRIVRIDDMAGTNWTVLTQSPPVNGISYDSFNSPTAVAIDTTGKIYVTDNESYQPAIIRVDDMTGANWTSVYTGSGSGGLNSISIDSSGTIFTGGGGAKLIINMTGVLNSSGSIGPIGSYYVFGVTPMPLPAQRPSAIGFAPPTLSFSQNVGTTSPAQTITISNFGGTVMSMGSIVPGGSFLDTANCPTSLIPGSTCTASVTFTPTVTGPATGQLTVTDNSGNLGSTQVVPLSGTGTAPAASVTPTSLSFSSTVIGTTSSARTVTLQNTGTGPMQINSVSTSGPFNQTSNCSAGVAAGASCTVQVTFSPTVVGSATGTLTINDNAGTQTVSLSGSGSAPVTLSSTSISFGTVAVGGTSATKTVTLTNRQTTTLTFTGISTAAPFAIVSNTCGTSIAAGANCAVGVSFTPAAITSYTGTLTFTDSALNSPQTVSLSGSGSAPVTLSATSLSFSTTAVGNTSSVKSVTLTNRQNAALNLSGVAVSTNFAIASNTCGASVAAGGTCTVGVTFVPTVTGSIAGTLTFTDDAGNSPQTVSLSGSGSTPVTLSTSTLSFGNVTVGTSSSAKNVTVTNRQNVSLSFSSIVASAGFTVSSNTCGSSIAVGANCSIGVKFSPTATGSVSGTLTITDSAANSPQTVTLTGSGI